MALTRLGANQSINLATNTTGTLGVANGGIGITSGTTDQFLKFTGSTTLASAADNGSLVFINQVSSTSEVSNLTLDNVFTSTYTNYLIVGEYTLINGSGPEARILFRTGGSSGSDLTASEYNYHFIRANSDGDSLAALRATGAASCNFTGSTDEDSARVGARITWTVYDPFDSSVRTTVSGHGKFTQTNGDSAATVGYCDYKGTTSITGIKFYASTDNVKDGHFRVYGIVDS